MSPATGIQTFDRTLQKTHIWFDEVGEILGWEDKERVFQGVRSVLHALRDRLTVEEATQLGSQLPFLLTGFYYEDGKPAASPIGMLPTELQAF